MSDKVPQDAFEVLYLEQRKKSQLLTIAVVVLAVATAGSLAWAISQNSNSSRPTNMIQGQDNQTGPGGMRGGMGMNMNVSQFFNEDGSINQDQVDSILDRMPTSSSSDTSFVDRFESSINQAVDDGEITQSQADELIEALTKGEENSEEV